MKKKDLTGIEFNGVTSVKFDHKDKNGKAFWVFRCHCHKHFITQGYFVTSGHTKSCGCIRSGFQKDYYEKVRQKILKNIEVCSSGCWEWKLSLNTNGYAQIVAFGKLDNGHRISYKVFKGDIPKGMWVLHSCDNRKCVNPDHLFTGTAYDNNFDMKVKGRRNDKKDPLSKMFKLKKEQVLEARQIYKDGLCGCTTLAKKYGVSERHMWGILNLKSWKDI